MAILVLCEKPTAAKAVASALAESQLQVHETPEGVRWYEFRRNGKNHIVAAAVGHLFTLRQAKKRVKGQSYPVFDMEWIPTWQASKFGAFSKRYYDTITQLAGKADDVIVATDYDTEGDVIAMNILRFMFGREDARRMKFSTMTKDELQQAYENMEKHLNFGQTEAGLTRHYLDFMWGISLSRALMSAIKTAGRRFRILSVGRVQGPTLHLLARHEKRIRAFKPKPFWELAAKIKVGKQELSASYEKSKIWDKAKAEKILAAAAVKHAVVGEISKRQLTQKPPKPYNTTSFLADVYRYFGYSPMQAMAIAEALYQAGLISYPRTSSEKLPKDINYKKILSGIAKQGAYAKDVQSILAKPQLMPVEGAKTDPAHPALFPTGELPKKLGDKQKRVYDLVIRRFLAAFGEPARRESQRVQLDIGGCAFFLSGLRTIEPGWTKLYGRYAEREEIILPELAEGGKLPVSCIEIFDKQTQPPARYSQGSVLKELEARNLGTKSTRAQILQILYNRGYVVGRSIEVTDLGMKLSDVLEKNVPDIVSEKLTRHFEEEAEQVMDGKIKREQIVDEAKAALTNICSQFRKKEPTIGRALTDAIIESQEKQSQLGTCPRCGGTIKMLRLWHTKKRFAGCSGYPKCDFSAPLPAAGFISRLDKVCEQCKTPLIQVQREGARPFRMCLDIHCPTKKDWFDKKKLSSYKAGKAGAVKRAAKPEAKER